MACVKPVDLGVGEIEQISLSAFRGEKDIVLSPENYRLRFVFPQKCLPLWIEVDVGAVIVEQVKVQSDHVGPLHECKIRVPVVRTYQLRSYGAVEVNVLDRVKRHKCLKRLLGLAAPVFPECSSNAIPGFGKANLIRITILDDQPFECLRIPAYDAETDGPAVILNVQSVSLKTFQLQEFSD